MDFQEVLRHRRAVRTYDPRPVPRDLLERITNAAVVRAPSAGFSQGLRLVVVTDSALRKEIAAAAAEEELAAHGRPRWKAEAPVHVVVLVREADYHERYQQQDKLEITAGTEIEWPAPYWYVDAGAAAMALMFAAIDEGLPGGRRHVPGAGEERLQAAAQAAIRSRSLGTLVERIARANLVHVTGQPVSDAGIVNLEHVLGVALT